MDIVVADIPPKFGMLLSRSWAAKIKGTMQMDLTYATIPMFSEQRRLYRETRMAYMVSSKDKPQNFPIYSCDIGLRSTILFNESAEELLQALEEQENEVLELRKQVEEGRKVEEIMKKQYLEKEEKYQVEVNILKGKLQEKDKLLQFQDSTKVLHDILSSQRSPTIKTGIGFHESIESESSSQGEARNSNAKSKMLNKEMRGQPHQQPRK